jgi:hypothetical protein
VQSASDGSRSNNARTRELSNLSDGSLRPDQEGLCIMSVDHRKYFHSAGSGDVV